MSRNITKSIWSTPRSSLGTFFVVKEIKKGFWLWEGYTARPRGRILKRQFGGHKHVLTDRGKLH